MNTAKLDLGRTGRGPFAEGVWVTDSVFVPLPLVPEFTDEWARVVGIISSWFPGQLLMVSSIISTMLGTAREAGGSHIRGFALDLAPIMSKTQALAPDNKNPRLGDDRALLAFIAQVANEIPYGIFLEGDHLHIDMRYKPGSYAFSTHRKEYSNDSENATITSLPIERRCFIAYPDGRLSPVGLKDGSILRPFLLDKES